VELSQFLNLKKKFLILTDEGIKHYYNDSTINWSTWWLYTYTWFLHMGLQRMDFMHQPKLSHPTSCKLDSSISCYIKLRYHYQPPINIISFSLLYLIQEVSKPKCSYHCVTGVGPSTRWKQWIIQFVRKKHLSYNAVTQHFIMKSTIHYLSGPCIPY